MQQGGHKISTQHSCMTLICNNLKSLSKQIEVPELSFGTNFAFDKPLVCDH